MLFLEEEGEGGRGGGGIGEENYSLWRKIFIVDVVVVGLGHGGEPGIVDVLQTRGN